MTTNTLKSFGSFNGKLNRDCRFDSTQSMTDSEAKLGRLLVSTGLVSERKLAANLTYAKSVKLPLGVVLLLSGTVNSKAIDKAIEIQQLIRNGLPPSVGRMVLRYAISTNVSTHEAMEAFALVNETSALDCWLTEILSTAEVLHEFQIDELKEKASNTKTTWIHVAVEHNVITLDVLAAAMHALVLLDQGYMTFSEVIELMQAVNRKPGHLLVFLSDRVRKHQFDARTVNLPARLYASYTITERNVLDLISLAYQKKVDSVSWKENVLVSQTTEKAIDFNELLSNSLSRGWASAKIKVADKLSSVNDSRHIAAFAGTLPGATLQATPLGSF
ncbi:MAG: hypothetical protein K2X93_21365 [Candidatus Obscuribacterales bacterium]|nr:hypothetical protein [Candidatus Obscuribacterales bacterium]